MTFEKGSLILVEFTAKIKDSGKIYDTTREADAKEDDSYAGGGIFGPRIVSISEPSFPVLRGFDEALAKSEVGAKITIDVPPEKGFGERDSGKVRAISFRKLGEDAEKVSVGDEITVDGKRGTVRHMGSGRVHMDYNHPYAGKTITFEAEIVKALEHDDEKVRGILDDIFIGSKIEFTIQDRHARIEIPESMFESEDLQRSKSMARMGIFKFAPNLAGLSFVETHKNAKTGGAKQDETKQESLEHKEHDGTKDDQGQSSEHDES